MAAAKKTQKKRKISLKALDSVIEKMPLRGTNVGDLFSKYYDYHQALLRARASESLTNSAYSGSAYSGSSGGRPYDTYSQILLPSSSSQPEVPYDLHFIREILSPEVLQVVHGMLNRIILEGRKPNKKESLFISREVMSAFIYDRLKVNASYFEAILPSEKIVLFGKKARERALEKFYEDVATAIYYKNLDDGGHYSFTLQDFKRFIDPELWYKAGFKNFLRQKGISFGKVSQNKIEYRKELRLWREEVKEEAKFVKDIMERARQEIMRRNISVFGEPKISTRPLDSGAAGVESYKNGYNCYIDILNDDKIKESTFEMLRTDLLSFQALTAPTLSCAHLDITVKFAEIDDSYAGFYNPSKKEVFLQNTPACIKRNKSTVYHELMHAVDAAIPEVMQQTFAILKGRCSADPKSDLDFFSEYPDRPESTVVRDSFVNSYTGRIYMTPPRPPADFLMGLDPKTREFYENYPPSMTEVSTTAIDQFAYPATMLRLLTSDLELFSHALAICYGTYVEDERTDNPGARRGSRRYGY